VALGGRADDFPPAPGSLPTPGTSESWLPRISHALAPSSAVAGDDWSGLGANREIHPAALGGTPAEAGDQAGWTAPAGEREAASSSLSLGAGAPRPFSRSKVAPDAAFPDDSGPVSAGCPLPSSSGSSAGRAANFMKHERVPLAHILCRPDVAAGVVTSRGVMSRQQQGCLGGYRGLYLQQLRLVRCAYRVYRWGHQSQLAFSCSHRRDVRGQMVRGTLEHVFLSYVDTDCCEANSMAEAEYISNISIAHRTLLLFWLLHLIFWTVGQLTSSFWPMYKRYSSSGQNNVTLCGSFSRGDTLLDYCSHLFKVNDVVLKLASPDIGSAGVESDLPRQVGQGTRALSTNSGKRRRVDDSGTFATLTENSTTMADSIVKQTSVGELATLSETLKNLRAADVHPRFIEAVERKLDRILFPAAEKDVPGSIGHGGSSVGFTADACGSEGGDGDGTRDDESESFL